MPGNRKVRIEAQLRREIASCVTNEIRDPRIGFITITRVRLSDDLHYATAYYTLLGDSVEKRTAEKALRGVQGYVQKQYAKVLRMRHLPTLRFAYDDEEVKRQELDELLRQQKNENSDSVEKAESESE